MEKTLDSRQSIRSALTAGQEQHRSEQDKRSRWEEEQEAARFKDVEATIANLSALFCAHTRRRETIYRFNIHPYDYVAPHCWWLMRLKPPSVKGPGRRFFDYCTQAGLMPVISGWNIQINLKAVLQSEGAKAEYRNAIQEGKKETLARFQSEFESTTQNFVEVLQNSCRDGDEYYYFLFDDAERLPNGSLVGIAQCFHNFCLGNGLAPEIGSRSIRIYHRKELDKEMANPEILSAMQKGLAEKLAARQEAVDRLIASFPEKVKTDCANGTKTFSFSVHHEDMVLGLFRTTLKGPAKDFWDFCCQAGLKPKFSYHYIEITYPVINP